MGEVNIAGEQDFKAGKTVIMTNNEQKINFDATKGSVKMPEIGKTIVKDGNYIDYSEVNKNLEMSEQNKELKKSFLEDKGRGNEVGLDYSKTPIAKREEEQQFAESFRKQYEGRVEIEKEEPRLTKEEQLRQEVIAKSRSEAPGNHGEVKQGSVNGVNEAVVPEQVKQKGNETGVDAFEALRKENERKAGLGNAQNGEVNKGVNEVLSKDITKPDAQMDIHMSKNLDTDKVETTGQENESINNNKILESLDPKIRKHITSEGAKIISDIVEDAMKKAGEEAKGGTPKPTEVPNIETQGKTPQEKVETGKGEVPAGVKKEELGTQPGPQENSKDNIASNKEEVTNQSGVKPEEVSGKVVAENKFLEADKLNEAKGEKVSGLTKKLKDFVNYFNPTNKDLIWGFGALVGLGTTAHLTYSGGATIPIKVLTTAAMGATPWALEKIYSWKSKKIDEQMEDKNANMFELADKAMDMNKNYEKADRWFQRLLKGYTAGAVVGGLGGTAIDALRDADLLGKINSALDTPGSKVMSGMENASKRVTEWWSPPGAGEATKTTGESALPDMKGVWNSLIGGVTALGGAEVIRYMRNRMRKEQVKQEDGKKTEQGVVTK